MFAHYSDRWAKAEHMPSNVRLKMPASVKDAYVPAPKRKPLLPLGASPAMSHPVGPDVSMAIDSALHHDPTGNHGAGISLASLLSDGSATVAVPMPGVP
jgi:hypothetical protein